ncbi:MAG: hybrid sensor histidine kinase/response regulator [Gammaproteobacteria bacterium]|nr:hybrid sensor histidine kinase/response regulator [Gammaproteobacteria bacterium]
MNDQNIPKVNASMLDLFRIELENHSGALMDILLNFGDGENAAKNLESLMRASHSIKGAAKLVNVVSAVKLAHIMEDCFVAAQNRLINFNEKDIDVFIKSVDFLSTIASFTAEQHDNPEPAFITELEQLSKKLEAILNNECSASNTSNTEHGDTATDSSENTGEIIHQITFQIPDTIDPVMLDLFRTELDNNIETLANGLLNLEQQEDGDKTLEQLMRSSHSIKGAAKLVCIDTVVKLAHAMEDYFVAAQNKQVQITENAIDLLLKSIDLLKEISLLAANEHRSWADKNAAMLSTLIYSIGLLSTDNATTEKKVKKSGQKISQPVKQAEAITADTAPTETISRKSSEDSVVRVSSKRINKLMGLAGELSVTSNWIKGYSDSMMNLKRKHNEVIDTIHRLRTVLEEHKLTGLEQNLISSLQSKAETYRDSLTSHILNLDDYDRRSSNLTTRLNHEVIASRMRPFKDGIQGYKRMVRDISRSLNKNIQLIINGEDTQLDRDILEKIEAPINHMIRNAIDHGIEPPEERIALGKPEQGTIRLEASHNAGRLLIVVADDGRGVDVENIRSKALDRKLINKAMAENLSKSELLDFLFLPAFSTREEVTEISGRGVGLDVVHSTLQELRGKLHATTELGSGMQINMELPLTLSVIRSLLVTVNHEYYAFPLAAIYNLIKIKKSDISVLEDKQYITFDDKHVGLIHIAQILGMASTASDDEQLSIVIVGDWNNLYGLVVDEMIGERGLALRPLDSRLGKIKDINAVALTDDGDPILVFDVDDIIVSIKDIISGKDIIKVGSGNTVTNLSTKRILVVDDSLTVREVEKNLLESRGYHVDVAIDGVDAWNTVRTGQYDLVISDVDMPRMNGIELVSLIKNDAALRTIPVMMVSYKDRPEDKQKGLEAGADYYLAKGSFHDETLVEAVLDLIGEAS